MSNMLRAKKARRRAFEPTGSGGRRRCALTSQLAKRRAAPTYSLLGTVAASLAPCRLTPASYRPHRISAVVSSLYMSFGAPVLFIKMANIFRNLFRHKKVTNKENESPPPEEFERGRTSRHSLHEPKRSGRRWTRFADDGDLPATAAYHTTSTKKFPKGPQSCPLGYREESEASNRSYEIDVYHGGNKNGNNKKEKRKRDDVPQQKSRRGDRDYRETASMVGGQRSQRYAEPHYRRSIRESSEYGSGDPSPIGQMGPRHSHYDVMLDDSENDDFDVNQQIRIVEKSHQQYVRLWKESEKKRLEEEQRVRELMKERERQNEFQLDLFRQIDKLTKDKERYKRKIKEMESQMRDMQSARMYPNSFGFCMQPGAPSMQSSVHHSQRMSYMTPIGGVSSSNTPTTSAMDSTAYGAGETMAQTSEMSLLQPQQLGQLHLSFTNPPFCNPEMDDEEDETKNFRTNTSSLSIETPRCSAGTSTGEILAEIHNAAASVGSESDITLNEAVQRDEGYSTTTDRSSACGGRRQISGENTKKLTLTRRTSATTLHAPRHTRSLLRGAPASAVFFSSARGEAGATRLFRTPFGASPIMPLPFHPAFGENDPRPRLFCVSYAQPTIKSVDEEPEEIYSSLKKARGEDSSSISSSSYSDSHHVTRIPLGSPRPVEPRNSSSNTVIHVSAGPQRIISSTASFSNVFQPSSYKPEVKIRPTTSSEDVRRRSRHPSGDFEGWAGRAMEGRVMETPNHGPSRSANSVRSYWESNIAAEQRARQDEAKHRKPRSYGFPKWRSTDALSASLVASNPVRIPTDSRIPEERLRKMEETEREAREVKREIHEIAEEPERRLHKGKSLDSLVMQVDYKPWYDTEKIKQAVSRESIANIGLARDFFENVASRDWRSATNSRRDSISSVNTPAPPLPPKSDHVQLRQMYAAAATSSAPPARHVPTVLDSPPSSHNSSRFEAPANGHGGRIQQQGSPQSAVDPIEQQEVLLMLYMKQNMDILTGLGISIPSEVLQEMDELQGLPVELRVVDDESQRMSSPSARNGRYNRKSQPPVPRANGKFKKNDFRANPMMGAVGEQLISADIRNLREREDELRRTRHGSELSMNSFDFPQNGYGSHEHFNDFQNMSHHENYGYTSSAREVFQ
ncbi:unnamed protein product [Caenorhabditis auriculariae]|uniref:Uncharacterized protein n=1 Tax=Caenorhabditis auriculariae TaxID=2777116 RepID=A0A8S1HMB1_9PELO|nr:unnamed protein product [Caenorhabditis auriculariae]